MDIKTAAAAAESHISELGSPVNMGDDNHNNGLPAPIKTLNAYHRAVLGKKHLFATSGDAEAQYFVVNPVPHKHADKWKPVLYRGDNPKYVDSSRAIARGHRGAFWESFTLTVGDGVQEVIDNERRAWRRKWYKFVQGCRKCLFLKPTPPKKPLEDEQEVVGLVMTFRMKRWRLVTRTMVWEIDGRKYRWTGTRRFLPERARRFKWLSQDFKLLDEENNVIATFEKDRWSTFTVAEKYPGTPNKKKTCHGVLRIYPGAYPVDDMDDKSSVGTDFKNDETIPERKGSNPHGPHSGNLTEEAIVLTAWVVVEAEHRLRYKIFDIIKEVSEYLQ